MLFPAISLKLKCRDISLAIIFVICLPISAVQADELLLKNGDRLTGEVLNEADGVLKFKTSYAGILSIKWKDVSEVRTDKPMTLLLEDDGVLTGAVIKTQGDKLQIENTLDESEDLLLQSSVKEINPEPWRINKGNKLSGMINVSVEYDRGNNDNDEIDLDGRLVFRRFLDRVSLHGQYEENRTNEITTKLKWLATADYDYFPRRDWDYMIEAQDWFVGVGVNLKKDEFANLRLRSRFGPHIGYQFFESKPLNLFLRGGLEAVKEEYLTEEENEYWASTWRLMFDQYIYREKLQFYFVSDGLYGFDSPDKIIVDNWIGFRFPLYAGFIASIEAETDYDSQPATDAEALSVFYRLKLGYKF